MRVLVRDHEVEEERGEVALGERRGDGAVRAVEPAPVAAAVGEHHDAARGTSEVQVRLDADAAGRRNAHYPCVHVYPAAKNVRGRRFRTLLAAGEKRQDGGIRMSRLLLAAALGATSAFMLDPQQGRRRRAALQDKRALAGAAAVLFAFARGGF